MDILSTQTTEKTWATKWKKVNSLAQGGQGVNFRVNRNNSDDIGAYFLKILKQQKNKECRERMFTEVACYEILDFSGIPKLIESNSQLFKDKDVELYLVAEFIEGASLQVIKVRPSVNQVISCVLRLCKILNYCHSKNVVHRDIKPANIILRDSRWEDPVLVDFGISSYDESVPSEKSINQEIGNRFLRLPEFAPNSSLKRDPRSDITLCAGILFYLLTSSRPSLLLDENHCMPHQRQMEKEKLCQYNAEIEIPKLFTLFDQAFSQKIDSRFQSIDEFIQRIHELLIAEKTKSENNTTEKINKIQNIINAPTQQANRRIMSELEKVMSIVSTAISEVQKDFGNAFNLPQTNYNLDPINFKIQNTLGLIYKSKPSIRFDTTYHAWLAGNEIILSANNTILIRFIENGQMDTEEIKRIVKEYLINNIERIFDQFPI